MRAKAKVREVAAKARENARKVNRQNVKAAAEVAWFLLGPAPEGIELQKW